jgi:uncharacterized NAD(P)/FAD-binding protein YdhS
MASAARTIAIVGAGFSGSVLAARLLQTPPLVPTRLILFERSRQIGTGLAYGAHPYPYLLNVPAGRMSALSEDPDHLIDYARQRLADVDADSYLTRAFYGEYLQHHLAQSEAAAPEHIQLERVRCEITSLHPLDLRGPVVVRAHNRQWIADLVVVASGDAPPLPKAYAAAVTDHEAYVSDPFRQRLTQPSDRQVLLIGTGPTMADMSVAASAANPDLELVAVSRRGLLPQPQAVGLGANAIHGDCPACEIPAGASLRQIVSLTRTYMAAVRRQGHDWRDALNALRKHVPRLWEGLAEADRRRFLRHVRTYWDVHRHRLPPQLAATLAGLMDSGRLQVHAGRVLQLVADGSRIVVHWRARAQSEVKKLCVDRVIDCSGSDGRIRKTRDPLLRTLIDSGIATVDSSGLGLNTAEHGALVNCEGDTARQVFYLGPMLRARHWEATAVGELRLRVDALADALRAECQIGRSSVVDSGRVAWG